MTREMHKKYDKFKQQKDHIMKKLLLGSLFLTIFAFAIMIFQVSCQKDATANTDNGLSSEVTQVGKIIFLKRVTEGSAMEIWLANYDGSNQSKVNVTFPNGFEPTSVSISPDHQSIFIIAWNNGGKGNIYSCKVDGSSLTKIIDGLNYTVEGLRNVTAY